MNVLTNNKQSAVHISKMSGKLFGMYGINTDTTINPFCQKMQKGNHVCKECYSQAMLTGLRKSCVASFRRNYYALSERIIPIEELPVFKKGIPPVRINAHGEIVNAVHLKNIYRIAKVNPKIKFTMWTKRKDLVKRYLHLKQPNVIQMYSTAKINGKQVIPIGYDKVFTVYTMDYALKNRVKINCHGDCMACMKCYRSKKVVPEIREIIKSDQTEYYKAKGGKRWY